MDTGAAWVPLDPNVLSGLQVAVLAMLWLTLAGLPGYFLVETDPEDGGHDATDPAGLTDTPKDSPMRSPDYCWGHGRIETEEK